MKAGKPNSILKKKTKSQTSFSINHYTPLGFYYLGFTIFWTVLLFLMLTEAKAFYVYLLSIPFIIMWGALIFQTIRYLLGTTVINVEKMNIVIKVKPFNNSNFFQIQNINHLILKRETENTDKPSAYIYELIIYSKRSELTDFIKKLTKEEAIYIKEELETLLELPKVES